MKTVWRQWKVTNVFFVWAWAWGNDDVTAAKGRFRAVWSLRSKGLTRKQCQRLQVEHPERAQWRCLPVK